MPEKDISIIWLGGAIITSLIGVIGILWAVWRSDRKRNEEKNETQTNRVIEEIKAGALAVQKIQTDVLNMVQDNQKTLMNGHAALKEDIENIEELSKENKFKIELIEEKLKNK